MSSLGNLLARVMARLAGRAAARQGLTVDDAPAFFQNVELACGYDWDDLLRIAPEEELFEAYLEGVKDVWFTNKEAGNA